MKKLWLVLIAAFLFLVAAGCGTGDTSTSINNDVTSETVSHHTKANHVNKKPAMVKDSNDSESSSDKDANEKDAKSETNDQQNEQDTDDNDNNENKSSKTKSHSNTTSSTHSRSSSEPSDTNDQQSSDNQNDSQPSSQSNNTSQSNTKQNDNNNNASADNQNNAGQNSDDNQAEESKDEPQETVTVSVTTGDVQGTILSETNVPVEDGDTAMDVTRTILKQNDIQFSIRGSKGSAYMEGIDNLYEKDEGPLSGWQIRVNGDMIDRSAGVISVEAGDTVHWQFTKNFIEDADN